MNPLEYLFRIKTDGRPAENEIKRVEQSLSRVERIANRLGGRMVKQVSGFMTGLGKIGADLGATYLVNQALSKGGQITDLSKRSGVSQESVQRWMFAAQQGGAQVGDVLTSYKFLQRSMVDAVDNPKSDQAAAFARLGITPDVLQSQPPEKIFEAVSAIMGQRAASAQGTKDAMDLFGRSGDVMLGLSRDGFAATSARAPIMAETTTARLDSMGDTRDEYWSRLVNAVGTVIDIGTASPDELASRMRGGTSSSAAETGEKTVSELEKIRQELSTQSQILRDSL